MFIVPIAIVMTTVLRATYQLEGMVPTLAYVMKQHTLVMSVPGALQNMRTHPSRTFSWIASTMLDKELLFSNVYFPSCAIERKLCFVCDLCLFLD